MKVESVNLGGDVDLSNSEVDIIMVLDRSGSMASTIEETIAGFNSFIKEQKKAGENGKVSLFQFDNEFDIIHNGISLSKVPELTTKTFVPRGSTALYDAVGRSINTAAERYGDKTPDTVLFVILTDGMENASKEFKAEDIKKLIEKKTDEGWQFIFVGADKDAITTGVGMGISASNSVNYMATAAGSTTAFETLSRNTSMYRSAKVKNRDMGSTSAFFASSSLTETLGADASETLAGMESGAKKRKKAKK